MIPLIVKVAAVAFAGAGATDFVTAIFGRRPAGTQAPTPMQAIASVNWVRVVLQAAIIAALYFLVTNILEGRRK